jgi:hypothetical protein
VHSPERARVEVLVQLKKSYEKLSPQERDTVRKVLAGITGRRTIMSKVAIITGASGGLGSAVARRLATVGFAIAERRMTMKTDALTNPIIKTAIEA